MFFLYMVLIVALMAVLSVVLTKVTVKLMGKLGGQAIYRLQESAEFVSRTGLVPPFWREKVERPIKRLQTAGADRDRIERAEMRARRRCMRQMRKLLQFARNSSTISDEEARRALTETIVGVSRDWRGMSWREMTGT